MLKKKRLLSLDVLRGITVAGMILVNNSGGSFTYAPLKHAVWNGMTPCDLIFPFFLFIMGISTYISLKKFNFNASSDTLRKIVKRTLVILAIGWGIHWFGHICKGEFFPFEQLRLTGVMTRIALCYGVVSVIAVFVNHKYIIPLILVLLGGYSFLLIYGNGYNNDETNLLAVIDRYLIGSAHLYGKSPIDPEGLISTISALAHTLIGFCCGAVIMRGKEVETKVMQLFLVGFVLLAMGWLVSYGLPLNKRIWSPSFTLVTCGAASALLALLMYFIDIKKKDKWCTFFLIFGVNPLFLYVFSEVLAIVFLRLEINTLLYGAIHFVIGNPYISSLIYALLFTAILGSMGYMLYKRKIYIKI